MKRVTKALLVLGVGGILLGLVVSSGVIKNEVEFLYAVLPTGATCLGLFLISLMLEKESRMYNDDQRARASAEGKSAALSMPSPQEHEDET
jgi:hypothetical protein